MLNYIIWNANPVLLDLGVLQIRWYGFLYALGFFIAITILGKIFKRDNAPDTWQDTIFIYMVVSVIVGARLGHCLFYGWDYYSQNLIEILYVWQGGLASHGGAFAMLVGVYLFSKKYKVNFWWLGDRLFVVSSFVAGVIRMGNLMNSEIYGHPTKLSWGFVYLRDLFPPGNEMIQNSPFCSISHEASLLEYACHPTQIYEGGAYFLLFVAMMWLYWKKNAGEYRGLLTGIGFAGIFIARIVIEGFKQNQEEFESVMQQTIGLNMGQLLSVPFIILGVTLIIYSVKKGKKKEYAFIDKNKL